MSASGHAPDDAAAPEAATTLSFREHNRQLQFLTETFPEGVVYQYTVTAGGEKMLTYLGRGAEKIFGERPAQMPADVEWLTARILPEDEPGIAAAGELSRRDLTRLFHDVRIRRSDGSKRWVSIRTQPRELPDGDVIWDGVIVDVTEHHRDKEAVQRQMEFLAALNETTLELMQRRNVTDLLQALVERSALLLNSPHAEISLIDDGALVVRAFSKGREFLAGDRVTRDAPALSWRAIDSRAPVVTERYIDDPDSREVYRESGVQAAAVFPIVRGAECVGVLGFARAQPGLPFSADDIREGKLLAQMAALMLDNASIHEEAVRAAESRTAALRESEERFRGVFDQSPIIISVMSVPEGRIVEANAAAITAFGYSREECIGRTSLDLNLWVDVALRERYLKQLRTDGCIRGLEVRMRRKNGEIFTIVYNGSIVMIGGKPYSLNLLEDITARKQSEADRDQSQALTRATLESTADGILVVNAAGHIETFNKNFSEMWRLEADDIQELGEEPLLRALIDQLVEPEKLLGSVRDIYARSEAAVFDVLHCKDGRIFERYSRPQLIRSKLVGRVWSFRDITKRRRAEAALREGEERFRVLAEVSPVGIFRSDPNGQCVFVNDRWCELAGLSATEAMGDGWTKALHPDDRPQVAGGWAEAVRAHEPSAAEFRFVKPDGTVTWLVGQSRAHFDIEGKLAGYVGSITDVTNLKRAEEERKKIEEQLRQSRKMESLGTLAGGIAHDFNNILNGTFGFVDLARLNVPEGHAVHEWLDRIAASSQRARELVRQILAFSRKQDGERTPLRLHSVVGEALRLLRSTLPATVELAAHLSDDAPPILADATQIHQVVLNLCTNAWQAMPAETGRLAVTLEPWTVTPEQAAAHPELRAGACVRLSVTDNGCGMDAATLEHIFEPFFTTKETGKGTGLGLAVVHGIVKAHDGAILVRSAPGQGATFELYFPAVAIAPAPPPAAPQEIPRGHGERILVVDDDPISGFALEKIIETLGYTVTRCMRPEEALERFTAAPTSFDLVVSDFAMPGMNGAELIGRLAPLRPDLPIIVVSGFLEHARQQIIDQGIARAILDKPVSRAQLAHVLVENLRTAR